MAQAMDPAATQAPAVEDGSIAGRKAIVTGPGLVAVGIAEALRDRSCDVALVGDDGSAMCDAASTSRSIAPVLAIDCQFGSRADVERAFGEAASALGGVDIVVHARVEHDWLQPNPISTLPEKAWEQQCEGQVRGAILCAQAAFTQFKGHGGRLIYIVPSAALTGVDQMIAYVSGAEGIRGLAKSAARAWGASQILVNMIAVPIDAMIDSAAGGGESSDVKRSPWNPALGRMPDPRADVGPVVAFFAGDLAQFVTGETIVVDGGMVMK